jgi:hypothetical protein
MNNEKPVIFTNAHARLAREGFNKMNIISNRLISYLPFLEIPFLCKRACAVLTC